MRSLLLMLFSALWGMASATHIIGGELFYSYLGNDEYEITLKIYRDCGPNNTNGTGFDASAEVAAYTPGGAYVASMFFSPTTIVQVPVVLNDPCLTPPSTICVEEATYISTMFLASGTGGYVLSYQRCCRSPNITNLFDPMSQGLTCTVNVSDPAVSGNNSSPRFASYPPIALCMGQAMSFDHAATDPDGDLLVYDLAAPYVGGDQFNPLPSPPAGPPFATVTWANTYSVNNMIDATPPLAIDPGTGTITLTPTQIGSYVVGVRVKEFRNGVQLSEVIRDFRFDVVPCVVQVISAIADQDAATLCSGLSVTFNNNSTNGDFYHWDFGVPGVANDTSSLAEPAFTFPQAGTYTVTLVANPGWPCADTSVNTFALSPPVTVSFIAPPINCIDEQPLTLQATGNFTSAASVVWGLGAGSAPDSDQPITHPTFPANGTFAVDVTVTENGCTDSFTDSVTIHPRPVPLFTADTAGCIPLDARFTNLSSAWTPMSYLWDFGDGGTSTDADPQHTYTTEGFFDVRLAVSTSDGCIATETLTRPALVQVWPQPYARFAVDPAVASLMQPVIEVNDLSEGTYQWDFELDGLHFDTTHFTYTFDDAGWHAITLIATSGLGCSDTTSLPVFVGGHFFYAPNAFSPDGDGVNEVWRPSVRGARFYRLELFDRWGQVRFSTTDPKSGWDGEGLPPGIYAYKAWLSEWGPLEYEYNGSVLLVR